MPHAYPLMLDVADRLVVIIGGGAVAARKAAGLIECGATRVRCVAPEFDDAMPDGVERVRGGYESRHLDGAGLVFAATSDPTVNAAIVRDAHARGLLVNRADADETEPGDFATPARLHAGAVTVAVAAGGSPALATLIRDGVRERWDERWSRMAGAMQTLRPAVLRSELPESRRKEVFRALATPEALATLGDGGMDGLQTWLRKRFPDLSLP
jgi:siroheme synthase-like protein